MDDFQLQFLKKREKLPFSEKIKAGYLLAFKEDKILSFRNNNEWMIPRGEIMGKKSLKKAFRRNFSEKYGLECDDAQPYIILNSEKLGELEVYFISDSTVFDQEKNTDNKDKKLEFVDIEKILFQPNFEMNKELLWIVIQNARAKLGLSYW